MVWSLITIGTMPLIVTIHRLPLGRVCLLLVLVLVFVGGRHGGRDQLETKARLRHERMVLDDFFSLGTIDLAVVSDRRISTDMWVWV